MAIYEPDLIDRGRAWVHVAAGELSVACETLAGAAARAADWKLHVAEALLHDVARLGQPATVAARLATLADIADGEFVTALAGHAGALVTRKPPDLQAAALTFPHS